MTDPYAEGVYQWWHLSRVPPELLAAEADNWLGKPGNVLDIGCGLGVELAHLAQEGWRACGIDVSAIALQRARVGHAEVAFIEADARRLPFAARAFDLVLDRGCFQYLDPRQRRAYSVEAGRVLRPDGRMLLRACLNCAGIRNDITEDVIANVFAGWTIDFLKPVQVPSDTREMPALEVRLRSPSGDGDGPPVPAAYRGTEGMPGPVLFTLHVDGERFAIRRVGGGGTAYDWLSGPNKGYGFGSSGTPNRSMEEHRERIRVFLAMIDPNTGYIGDD